MMPGIAQANDDMSGMNALPCNPTPRMPRSTINAARARYPMSSSSVRNRNSRQICGRKMITLPTPAITPSTARSVSIPSPSVAATPMPIQPVPAAIQSMNGPAHV